MMRPVETKRPRASARRQSRASGFGPSDTCVPLRSTSTGPRRRISRIAPDNCRMEPGDTIGRFVLGEPIGAGVSALVFAARDGEDEVALKLLRPEHARDPAV